MSTYKYEGCDITVEDVVRDGQVFNRITIDGHNKMLPTQQIVNEIYKKLGYGVDLLECEDLEIKPKYGRIILWKVFDPDTEGEVL